MRRIIFQRIKLVVLIFLFLLTGIYFKSISHAEELKEVSNVLIINSYHQGFTWTKEENNGIMDRLQESSHNINIMTEYMDWKNHPTKDNLRYLYDYFKYKYQNKPIDIIITTDDAALEFVLLNRKEIFSDVPVVFSGVNYEGYEAITAGYDRVTGIIEEIDPTMTMKLALDINPSLENVYLLYDNSESGLSTGKLVIEKLKATKPNLNIISCNNMVYEDMINQVRSLGDDSIVLITTYYSDINHTIMDLEYVTKEVSQNSSVPVYHIYDFGLNKGALGGAMLSGRLQGEYAAALALRILHGDSIENIPVIIPDTTRVAFDYKQITRFNIPLKAIPKDSEIINKPFSFYETYKGLVHSVLTAFTVLISFVCVLLFYIRKIKKMKKNLAESHEELTQIYEELAASDEEMRQQYEEMLEINSKYREGEEKLSFLAYHDSLTGLPNKLSLYETAKDIFTEGNGMAALLFIDLDNFKYVNDTLGHALGDQLIVKVSERLKLLTEDNCSIYRLGGDEFILLLQGIEEIEEAEGFASRVLELFSEEFEVRKSVLHISLSIGIVIYPDHGSDLEQLLKYADIAMYRAKGDGRKNYKVYDDRMNQVFTERVDIEKQLRNALGNNEFEVYYQPQFNLKTNQMTGLEALLRWRNPVLGNVPPLKFIHIAEDTHDIIPIGTWVLQKACSFLKELHDRGYGDLSISVNISTLQLLQPNFCDIIEKTLKEYQINPHFLELEITETMLMESFESIIPRLEQLSRMQVRIALDDFGKGYSSLNYLKQLPINTLKVDKSFIDPIMDPERDTLAGQIVMIGKSMGMCVVAEGVERQEQLEYLARHNCDKIQGYLYSRPVAKVDVIRMLEES